MEFKASNEVAADLAADPEGSVIQSISAVDKSANYITAPPFEPVRVKG